MFALKSYQVAALEALEGFFERVRSVGLPAAWTETVAYDATALGEQVALQLQAGVRALPQAGV